MIKKNEINHLNNSGNLYKNYKPNLNLISFKHDILKLDFLAKKSKFKAVLRSDFSPPAKHQAKKYYDNARKSVIKLNLT